MNRYLFITVCFLLPWMTIRAQEEAQFIGSQASIQLNHVKSLWFNSSNAAGLAFESPENYNIVSAKYDYRKGGHKQVQQGDKETGMMFNTNGAIKINKIAVWGDFTFFNEYITGSTFNTNMYDPSVDMPYYIADPNKSDWKKQLYDLSAKAAIPIGERVGVGVDVNYFSRKGAKQLDPRSININYGVLASPSVVFKINQRNLAGISVLYQNTFERVDFRNVLSYQDQNVYIMRGLGNFSLGVVGGNSGIDPFYYKGNRYGIGAQYRMDGNAYKILLDVKYAVNTIDVLEQPTKPRRRGSVDKKDIEANVQIIRTGVLMHKLTISVLQSGTDGIEYIQEFNNSSGVQQWVTIAEYIKSTYINQYASLKYELFSGTENKKDYVWNTGLHLTYKSRDDEYVSPNSVFNTKNILGELPVKRNLSTTTVAVTTHETQLIDSILQYGLDHEALYTLLSDIKPMSSLITFYYPIANDDSLKRTSANILERNKHGVYLDKLYSVQQALNRLNFPDLEFVMIPYQRVQGNKRVIQLSVIRISALDSLLKTRESFFGQFGLVPGTHPVVVVTTIENADIYERYRGYGYLFGYPDYAVDFFTEASYQANVAKQFQPRKFFQIPVHARKDGYFVYAYPENHTPTADADSVIYYKARNVLKDYEKIREKYMDTDGTIRAYQLLLDHYKQ